KTLDLKANQAYNLLQVATFTDPDASAGKEDFAARIDWGDGFQSNGVVEDAGKDGQFKVLGSHTYVGHTTTSYTLKVTITDQLGSTAGADGRATGTSTPPAPTRGTPPAPTPPGTPAGPHPGSGTSTPPQGWFVSPAGTQTALGERPFGGALSPDGKF